MKKNNDNYINDKNWEEKYWKINKKTSSKVLKQGLSRIKREKIVFPKITKVDKGFLQKEKNISLKIIEEKRKSCNIRALSQKNQDIDNLS